MFHGIGWRCLSWMWFFLTLQHRKHTQFFSKCRCLECQNLWLTCSDPFDGCNTRCCSAVILTLLIHTFGAEFDRSCWLSDRGWLLDELNTQMKMVRFFRYTRSLFRFKWPSHQVRGSWFGWFVFLHIFWALVQWNKNSESCKTIKLITFLACHITSHYRQIQCHYLTRYSHSVPGNTGTHYHYVIDGTTATLYQRIADGSDNCTVYNRSPWTASDGSIHKRSARRRSFAQTAFRIGKLLQMICVRRAHWQMILRWFKRLVARKSAYLPILQALCVCK